jgi:hypothetical protein
MLLCVSSCTYSDAPALIYRTINSDQLYETRSLILEIPKVLTVEEHLGQQAWSFCSI